MAIVRDIGSGYPAVPDRSWPGTTDRGAMSFRQPYDGANLRTVQSKLEDAVSASDFGTIGIDNAADMVQEALNTGRSVLLPKADYRFDKGVSIQTRGQRLIAEPGSRIIPTGSFDVVTLTGGTSHNGVEGLFFDAQNHTGGYCIAVRGTSRVQIDDILMANPWNAVYVEQSNVCRLSRVWINNTRGTHCIHWYGDNSKRSDILGLSYVNVSGNTTARPTGITWDGNCHTLQVNCVTAVNCGYGVRILNSSGSTNSPAFGMYNDLEVDFPTQHAVSIEAGSFQMFNPNLYLHGSTGGSGIYVAPGISADYVHVSGGKITGHARYGIENTGRIRAGGIYFSGNGLGEISGPSMFEADKLQVDATGYISRNGGNPVLNWDATDYRIYDRASNAEVFNIGGTAVERTASTHKTFYTPVVLTQGPYADDAAAAAAGVPLNGVYRKTGGTVAWRQV